MVDKKLTMGVFATSTKQNESRVAIVPDHFNQIDRNTRWNIFLNMGMEINLISVMSN